MAERRTMVTEDFQECHELAYKAESEAYEKFGKTFPKLVKIRMGGPGQLEKMSDILDVSPLFDEKMPNGKNFAARIFDTASQDPAWDMVIMVSEAWIVEENADKVDKTKSIENHPDRKEICLVVIRSKERQGMAFHPIDAKTRALQKGELQFKGETKGRFARPRGTAN